MIDDGSHYVGHAIASFRFLFPQMPADAIYCIEDLHTSFWDRFGGGVPAPPQTAVGLVEDLVTAAQLLDRTFDRPGTGLGPRPPYWANDVESLLVLPGMAIVHKA